MPKKKEKSPGRLLSMEKKMIENEIITAIQNKLLVSCFYDGLPRVVEPHCLGRGDRGLLLRCYQTGGDSSKGGIPDWRLFLVTKIAQFRVLEEHFLQPAPGYKRNDNAMKFGIIAQL